MEGEVKDSVNKKKLKNTMIQSLLRTLGTAMVYNEDTNIDTNRKLWNSYAKEWDPNSKWVQDIAHGSKIDDPTELEVLGDEWSLTKDLEEIISEFIKPYIDKESIVAEIGSGGGRVSYRVAPLISELHCFDISEEMLKALQKNTKDHLNIKYNLLTNSTFPEYAYGVFDFVYAFDVFVHMDLHTMWQYFQEIHGLLKPKGKCFVSTSNLLAPGGWERFSKQNKYTVGGFYFTTPDAIDTLIHESGFEILYRNDIDPKNVYKNRDYLLILQKST